MDAIRRLEQDFEWVVVTARSEHARPVTESWLMQHFGKVPGVRMRPHWSETPAQFKTREVALLSPVAHFEDDPFTASWLAELGTEVMLVDWPRNAQLSAAHVTRVGGVGEGVSVVARRLAETA